MKITAEPRSDQWNADDFIGGPRTFTIAGVKVGTAEQKYDIELVEGEGRVWRPPLTILRVLIAAWGDEAATWRGRRVTLFRDPDVRFGSEAVGGIRVSHMSDLPGGKRFAAKVTTSRAHRATYTVEPIPDEPAAPSAPTVDLSAIDDLDKLRDMWESAPHDPSGDPMRKAVEARVAEIKAFAAEAERLAARDAEATAP